MYESTIGELSRLTRAEGNERYFILADPRAYDPIEDQQLIEEAFLGITLYQDEMEIYVVDTPEEIGELEKKAKELGIKEPILVNSSELFLDLIANI